MKKIPAHAVANGVNVIFVHFAGRDAQGPSCTGVGVTLSARPVSGISARRRTLLRERHGLPVKS